MTEEDFLLLKAQMFAVRTSAQVALSIIASLNPATAQAVQEGMDRAIATMEKVAGEMPASKVLLMHARADLVQLRSELEALPNMAANRSK